MTDKTLTEMSVEEIKSYLDEGELDEKEWSEAFNIYLEKGDWKSPPAELSPDEQVEWLGKVITGEIPLDNL
jgi:hypothetical protein